MNDFCEHCGNGGRESAECRFPSRPALRSFAEYWLRENRMRLNLRDVGGRLRYAIVDLPTMIGSPARTIRSNITNPQLEKLGYALMASNGPDNKSRVIDYWLEKIAKT